MNFNNLREQVQEFLNQLVIQWLAALVISLDEVRRLFRRWLRLGAREPDAGELHAGKGRAGIPRNSGLLESVVLSGGGGFVLVHLLDPLIITCARFSPDGRSLAYSGSNGTVTILDLERGRTHRLFREHRDWVTSVDWAPDNDRLASAGLDGTVRVWRAETGLVLFPPIVQGAEVRAVAWSPDGARLAFTGADHQVRIWPVGGSERSIIKCAGHSGLVSALAWSPCGTRLASGSQDWGVRIFDTGSGRLLRAFRNAGPVNALAWSPDPEGGLLASGSDDRLVRVWNTRTGACAFTYTGHRDYAGVCACAWSRATRIVSADWNFTIQEWTLPSETQKAAVSIVVPRPRVPLLDTSHIHTLAAHTTAAGTRVALGGDGWLTVGASPAEPSAMLGDSCGGRALRS
ncbi:MAG: WD40 repeat domain-containing protein [Streptosporangiaceae bacterium]